MFLYNIYFLFFSKHPLWAVLFYPFLFPFILIMWSKDMLSKSICRCNDFSTVVAWILQTLNMSFDVFFQMRLGSGAVFTNITPPKIILLLHHCLHFLCCFNQFFCVFIWSVLIIWLLDPWLIFFPKMRLQETLASAPNRWSPLLRDIGQRIPSHPRTRYLPSPKPRPCRWRSCTRTLRQTKGKSTSAPEPKARTKEIQHLNRDLKPDQRKINIWTGT